MSEHTFDIQWLTTFDGLPLRVAQWPTRAAPKGPVLMCTGRNESLERYEEFARGFAERGYAPWAFDWRGQGGSGRESAEPRRGHVASFEGYLRDLRQVLEEPLGGYCPLVLAHSMGAHLCLRHAHDEPSAFSALVLSAPMIAIETGPLPLPAAGWIAEVGKRVAGAEAYVPGHRSLVERSKRFHGNVLTHDRRRFDRNNALLDAHPELITGGATLGWLSAAVRSMRLALAPGFAEAIATPTLLLSAGEDRVVRLDAHRDYVARMPNARHRIIEGARHELLQETDERLNDVWHELDDFLAVPEAEERAP